MPGARSGLKQFLGRDKPTDISALAKRPAVASVANGNRAGTVRPPSHGILIHIKEPPALTPYTSAE
jgi:hypothetical protein